MKTDNDITCSVISDLMVLYTKGKTSEETNHLIHAHLGECAMCSRAFGLEPRIRGKVPLAPRPETLVNPEEPLELLRHWALPVWSFVLFLATRFVVLIEGLLRRLGISTANLKIKLYRARRKLAGRMVAAPETEAGISAVG